MALSDLIPPGGAVADLPGTSRKQVLQSLCELAQRTLHVPARKVLDAVMERERLGSTGVGDGVAIPHARTGEVDRVCGVFARLKTPVDFDAVDGRHADLVFLLHGAGGFGAEHLKATARVAPVPPGRHPHGPACGARFSRRQRHPVRHGPYRRGLTS